MKFNDSKGMSLIGLILIIILLVVGVKFGYEFGKKAINKEKLEDLKTTMLLIQGQSKIIADKVEIQEEDAEYIGTQITDISEYTYLEDEKGTYYKIETDDLKNMGISGIETNSEEFYIVDYKNCEVYYSLGYEGKYSLTDIQNTETTEETENNSIVNEND